MRFGFRPTSGALARIVVFEYLPCATCRRSAPHHQRRSDMARSANVDHRRSNGSLSDHRSVFVLPVFANALDGD